MFRTVDEFAGDDEGNGNVPAICSRSAVWRRLVKWRQTGHVQLNIKRLFDLLDISLPFLLLIMIDISALSEAES